jgi:Reverse transcriptase (RNA-dependent DNA polymerase)/Zinc knuckle
MSDKPAPMADRPSDDVGKQQHQQNNKGRVQRNRPPNPPKFEGKTDGLKGFIYDFGDPRQADWYTQTTREISEYVGRTMSYGYDITNAIINKTNPAIPEPPEPVAIPPATTTTTLQDKIWEKEIVEYVKRKSHAEQNVKTLYAIIWGQCTEALREKVRALANYSAMSSTGDGIALLIAIQSIVFKREEGKDPWHAWYEATHSLYIFRQGQYMTNEQYYQKFQNLVDVVNHCGGELGNVQALQEEMVAKLAVNPSSPSATEIASSKVKSQERFLATMFFFRACRMRYGTLQNDIMNERLQKQDRYPQTVVAAYNLLVNWKPDQRVNPGNQTRGNDGLNFANVGKKDKSHITCFNCKEPGHYFNECPKTKKEDSGVALFTKGVDLEDFDDYEDDDNIGFAFNQVNSISNDAKINSRVSKHWILLDNQSTIDVFYNKDLLCNIRPSTTGMRIHCNAGTTTTRMIGDLPGYGTVWYHPDGIANILSLSRISQQYRVTFDSNNGNEFVVHKNDGSCHRFKQSSHGLYFLNTMKSGTTLVTTVEDKKSKYSTRDYLAAVSARKLQNVLGFPTVHTLLNIVDARLLPNCPVTRQDILAAEDIFGPAVASLKGRTTRRSPAPVRVGFANIPHDIMSRYKDIVLAVDTMYVNNIAFFITVSRHIKFGTAEMISSKSNKVMITAIKQVQQIYQQRGFKITHILGDGEFDSLRAEISALGISLNTVARGEHVPEAERFIRTIKERGRCLYHTLPFTAIPKRLVVEMIYTAVFWLNAFPSPNGVSQQYGPRAIVTGAELDFKLHCKLEFGTYVQVHEEHDNSLAPRTTGALALRPTGNAQGSYYFYSLSSGRRLTRFSWTTLPMPGEIIRHIHHIARTDNANPGLAFLDRDFNIFTDDLYNEEDEDNSSYVPDPSESPIDDDLSYDTPLAGVNTDADSDASNTNSHTDTNQESSNDISDLTDSYAESNDDNEIDDSVVGHDMNGPYIENNMNTYNQSFNEVDDMVENEENRESEENETDDKENESNEENDDNQENEENEIADRSELRARLDEAMNDLYGQRSGRYNLRSRRPRDYSHIHTTLSATLLTQYSVKKGLQKFQERGVEAVRSELQQLHDRTVIAPKAPAELTKLQRINALAYLMFLKEKRSGLIKARGCADGRKQRAHTTKEESSSPTVSIEAVFLSCMIDALEQRDVATVDVPGAFMQADMDELVHMRLVGTMAELLVRIDPKLYRKYITIENGRQVLYVELRKALYGTLRAALLFWRKLTNQLAEWGFVTNPYDWCVANKEISGSQCTIIWHVDDLKISHKDPKVVTGVIEQLDSVFGTDTPLTVHRGKKHDYLGMVFDYSSAGKVKISMQDYITKMLDELPPDMAGEAATPAAPYLFTVNETPDLLPTNLADFFHHNVAKLLFLCKRARPDIQTAVAFLTTRVKAPDHDDYKKLGRVMKYLRATHSLDLTLEADDMRIMKWWVDGSYAIHPDMKSHTGGVLSFGKGAVYSTSTRQKLNTKSSTEAELVAVNDVLPQVLWTRYFLKEQGYDVKESVIFQDNQSAILLEKNGRGSSSKRTRHINIRYFFITDKVQNKEISISYCPTGQMLADVLTKPLQGTQFRLFRDAMLNSTGASTISLKGPRMHDTAIISDPAPTAQNHRSVLGNNENTATSSQDASSTRTGTVSVDSCTSTSTNADALTGTDTTSTGTSTSTSTKISCTSSTGSNGYHGDTDTKVRFKITDCNHADVNIPITSNVVRGKNTKIKNR